MAVANCLVPILDNVLENNSLFSVSSAGFAGSVISRNKLSGFAQLTLSTGGVLCTFTDNTLSESATVNLGYGNITRNVFSQRSSTSFVNAAGTMTFERNTIRGGLNILFDLSAITGIFVDNVFDCYLNSVGVNLTIGCSTVTGEVIGNRIIQAITNQSLIVGGAAGKFNFNTLEEATWSTGSSFTGQILSNIIRKNAAFNFLAFVGIFEGNQVGPNCTVNINSVNAAGPIRYNIVEGASTLSVLSLNATGAGVNGNRIAGGSTMTITPGTAAAGNQCNVNGNEVLTTSSLVLGNGAVQCQPTVSGNRVSGGSTLNIGTAGANVGTTTSVNNNEIAGGSTLNKPSTISPSSTACSNNRLAAGAIVNITANVTYNQNIIATATQNIAANTSLTRNLD
jgi:hypothetical protein